MALQTDKTYDLTGNVMRVDSLQVQRDAMLNTALATPVHFCAGTGAPTFSAAKGTVYSNITGSSTATRLYVNTDGATTWTNVTTAA
jgi:hypothetical protein